MYESLGFFRSKITRKKTLDEGTLHSCRKRTVLEKEKQKIKNPIRRMEKRTETFFPGKFVGTELQCSTKET